MPGKKKSYTQAEKLAYYKKKAAANYRGRGAYKMGSRPAPKSRAYGEAIGSGLGGMVKYIPGGAAFAAPASVLASKLGGYLGNRLGSYMGWGEYKVNKNSLMVDEGQSPANMHSSGQSTRICHREYVCDIISSATAGGFKLQNFPLQPGYSGTFPWMSSVALNFQKFNIRGAIAEFKSGSGDAITGTNTALGEVIISTNYNCADGLFVNRTQMENTQYCSSAKPSVSFVHVIECDPSLQAQENLYVSSKVTGLTGIGINEVNWGNLQVATVGCQGTNVNLGSLYITYDIELIQAIDDSVDRLPVGDWFSFAGATVTGANPCGTVATTADPANSLGGTLVGATYSFPANLNQGLFKFIYSIQGTAAAFTAPGATLVNCVLRPVMGNDTLSALAYPQNGLVASQVALLYTIEVTAANATITIGGAGAIPTNVTLGMFMIDKIDGDFYHT